MEISVSSKAMKEISESLRYYLSRYGMGMDEQVIENLNAVIELGEKGEPCSIHSIGWTVSGK